MGVGLSQSNIKKLAFKLVHENSSVQLPLCINYINQDALNLTLHQEILPVLPEVQVGHGPFEVGTA